MHVSLCVPARCKVQSHPPRGPSAALLADPIVSSWRSDRPLLAIRSRPPRDPIAPSSRSDAPSSRSDRALLAIRSRPPLAIWPRPLWRSDRTLLAIRTAPSSRSDRAWLIRPFSSIRSRPPRDPTGTPLARDPIAFTPQRIRSRPPRDPTAPSSPSDRVLLAIPSRPPRESIASASPGDPALLARRFRPDRGPPPTASRAAPGSGTRGAPSARRTAGGNPRRGRSSRWGGSRS